MTTLLRVRKVQNEIIWYNDLFDWAGKIHLEGIVFSFWRSRYGAFCNNSVIGSHFTFAPIVEWVVYTNMPVDGCKVTGFLKLSIDFNGKHLIFLVWPLHINALYSTLGQYLHTALVTLPSSHSTLNLTRTAIFYTSQIRRFLFRSHVENILCHTFFRFCFYQLSHGK